MERSMYKEIAKNTRESRMIHTLKKLFDLLYWW